MNDNDFIAAAFGLQRSTDGEAYRLKFVAEDGQETNVVVPADWLSAMIEEMRAVASDV